METTTESKPSFWQRISDQVSSAWKEHLQMYYRQEALTDPNAFLNPLVKALKTKGTTSIEKESARILSKALESIKNYDEQIVTVVNQKDVKLALIFSSISENPEIRESANIIRDATLAFKNNPDLHEKVSSQIEADLRDTGFARRINTEAREKLNVLSAKVEAEVQTGSMKLEHEPFLTPQMLEVLRNHEKIAAKVVLEVLRESSQEHTLQSVKPQMAEVGKRNQLDGMENLGEYAVRAMKDQAAENTKSNGL